MNAQLQPTNLEKAREERRDDSGVKSDRKTDALATIKSELTVESIVHMLGFVWADTDLHALDDDLAGAYLSGDWIEFGRRFESRINAYLSKQAEDRVAARERSGYYSGE